MTLRQYQDSFIKTIADMLMRFRRVACQLATGGGKTVTFSGISSRYLRTSNRPGIRPGSGKTVIIAVHRKELLQQTRKTCYNAFKISCQPVTAGMKFIPKADVYVCMIETVNRILKKPGGLRQLGDVGLVIIDEAHRLEFMKLHQYFPDQYILGFSATPQTASKRKPMKMWYDEIVCGIDIPQLISEGHLCQNITYAPKDTVDRMVLQQGGLLGGDFNDKIMGKEFSKTQYIHNTVKSYREHTPGTKALVFNVNIAHSQLVNTAFIDAGYSSKHLDSTMSDDQRDIILKWFTETPGAILNNVGIATTGIDIPTIETIIINKSTMSLPLWLQMSGRGSRPTPAKSAFIIIDMGGNAITHGDWNQARDWHYIFHNPGKPGKNQVAPIKICPKCEGVIHAAAKVCPLVTINEELCGYIFASSSIKIEAELHEFIVVTKNIDVEAIMKANKHKKEYYPFFQIGTNIADNAKKHIPEMTDEYALFILNRYYELGKEWLHTLATGSGKRKSFNKWHQTRAKEHLYRQLQERFPGWVAPVIETVEPDIHHGNDLLHGITADNGKPSSQISSIQSIGNIQSLKNMHYEL